MCASRKMLPDLLQTMAHIENDNIGMAHWVPDGLLIAKADKPRPLYAPQDEG